MATSTDPPDAEFEAVGDPPRRDGGGDAMGDFDDLNRDPAADARARLKAPAVCLQISATVTMLPCLFLAAFGLIELGRLALGINGSDSGRNADAAEIGPLLAGVGLIPSGFLAVIIFGAVRMIQMRRYGFAHTAAVLGIVSVVFLQVMAVFVLTASIWALVVLRDPAVKKQFRS